MEIRRLEKSIVTQQLSPRIKMPHNIKNYKIRKNIEAMKLGKRLRLSRRKKRRNVKRILTDLMRSVRDSSD